METGLNVQAIREELSGLEWELSDDGYKRSVYIGTVFNLAPSGKYYMPWACSNVTEKEAEQDEEWYEAVEQELDQFGLYLESGEGDPCDLYVAECRDYFYDDHMGPDA
jgi:hypothetical protein